MKKILIIFLILLFIEISAYAAYQPIPESQSNTYRVEIESLINKEAPLAKHYIKHLFKEVKNENNKYNQMILVEQGIPVILFEFYKKLTITTEKYTQITEEIPPTDWYEELEKQLMPHLKNNNVNTKKINNLLNFAKLKQFQLEKKYSNN